MPESFGSECLRRDTLWKNEKFTLILKYFVKTIYATKIVDYTEFSKTEMKYVKSIFSLDFVFPHCCRMEIELVFFQFFRKIKCNNTLDPEKEIENEFS